MICKLFQQSYFYSLIIIPFVLFVNSYGEREIVLNKRDIAKINAQFHEKIEAAGIIVSDTSLSNYIEKCLSNLSNDNELNNKINRIKILSTPDLNAFICIDGTLYIGLPILGMIDNESQLAFLLAHEMAHLEQEHILALRYELHEQTLNIARGGIMSSVFGSFGILLAGLELYYSKLAYFGFSKLQEREADSISLQRIKIKGYNAWKAKEIFSTLYKWIKYKEEKIKYEFSTHPKLLERFKACKQHLLSLNIDTTIGIIGDTSYQSFIQPHLNKITELLMKSNRINEIYTLSLYKIDLNPYVPEWHYLRGKVLVKYWPIDSFFVAQNAFKKAYSLDPTYTKANRDLGWLFLKNKQHDSAKVYLRKYLKNTPHAPDVSLIRFYLGR